MYQPNTTTPRSPIRKEMILNSHAPSNLAFINNPDDRNHKDNQDQHLPYRISSYVNHLSSVSHEQDKQHQSPIPLPVVSRSTATSSSLLNDNNNNNNVNQLSRRTSFGENNSRRNLDDAYNDEMSVSIQSSNMSDVECQQGVFYLPNQVTSPLSNADNGDDTPGRKKLNKKRSLSLSLIEKINITRRGNFEQAHEIQSHSFCLSKKSAIFFISILIIMMILATSWALTIQYESYGNSSRKLEGESELEPQSEVDFEEQLSVVAPCSSYKSAIFCLYQSHKCTWIGGTIGCAPNSFAPSPSTSNSVSPTSKPTSRPTRKPTTRQPTTSRPTQPIEEYYNFPETSQPTKPVIQTESPTSPTNSPSLASSTKIPTTKTTSSQSPTPPDEYTDVTTTKSPTTKAPTTRIPTTSSPTSEGVDPTAGYDIEIIFSNPSTSPAVIQAFFNAKERWESIITSDIPSTYVYRALGGCFGATNTILSYDKVVDDLLIFADIEYIDGKGGVLGSAGPCIATNTGGRYTRVGLMKFDSTDLDQLQKDGTLESVITHEMGHVIGLGTLWSTYKLRDSTGKYYVGAGGAEGLKDLKGSGQPLIEVNGGPGTAGGHWDESTYQNELMTGWLSPKSKLSVMTVKALKDLGFTVNTQYADNDYVIPAKGRLRALNEVGHDVPNDVINKPILFDDDNVVPYDENGNRRIL